MASYDIITRNGSSITVPDFARLNIDGLQIIGDQTTDWNEPYNKNFLALDKKVQTTENSISAVNDSVVTLATSVENELVLKADKSNTYTKLEVESKIVELAPATDISGKVDKIIGKGLSTEDYTTTEKSSLADLVLFKQSYGTLTEFTTAFDAGK